MKKQFFIASLVLGALVLGTNNVQAQVAAVPVSATTTPGTSVEIILADAISITAGGDGAVSFNYATTADYSTDKAQTIANNLTVASTKNFTIHMKAGGANFVSATSPSTIPVSVLKIQAVEGGTMVLGQKPLVTLSTTDEVLVSGVIKGYNKTLNVQYSITSADAIATLFGLDPGSYTQTVTYTATAE